ncbi:MAG: 4Fe-4S dicluster domain-containing protein [Marinilabiliales bacterium]|nr:MAG: 4Fe-4S dicluster domain-containing protein [Marinilabiliales bacterium]
MSDIVIYSIITVSAMGAAAAIILFLVAKKFNVVEDPRIDLVEEELPAANCGGCGLPGCRAFAEALVKADDISGLKCPVSSSEEMARISVILGKEIADPEPLVAVSRCAGTPEYRPRTNLYDGAPACSIASALYTGEGGCPHGCLGLGDCVKVCRFDAIYMNPETGLPEVIDKLCTACNACVVECPRNIIELRKKNKKDRKIYVACINEEKGGVARKSCKVACIGCGKCIKACKFDAITMENNLAYIDPVKCKLCRKCAPECPTSAILEINFPVRKEKAEAQVQE